MCVCDLYIYIYILKPSARVRCDTRLVFKLSLTGLNLEFSFSDTDYLTKVKEPSLSHCLFLAQMAGFTEYTDSISAEE